MKKAEVLEKKRRESGGFKGQSGGEKPLNTSKAEKRRFFSLNISSWKISQNKIQSNRIKII